MSNSIDTLTTTLSTLVLAHVREELAAAGWFQVEASGRHLHLSTEDAKALFGDGYELSRTKYLSQPGQFVGKHRVSLVGPLGRLDDVIVIGPERAQTQIEVSLTDAVLLGVKPPCRDSGNLCDTPGIRIECGSAFAELRGGLIIAERHIHMKPPAAAALGFVDGDHVDFTLDSPRPLTFREVKVRVAETADNYMHIDYDEANAAGFSAGMFGHICTSPQS